MRTKIFFRADGGSKIGLGHLVRCIALAQILKEQFDLFFFSKEIPLNIAEEIKINGFGLNIINSESEFLDILNSQVIVVLDHYELETDYQLKVKNAGCTLVCIDDLHDKEFFADLIINHTPGILPSDYKAQTYTKFALGLGYSLLRLPFLEEARIPKKVTVSNSVLVCFGGSDPLNLTKKVLESLIQIDLYSKIVLVLGSSYSHLNSLESLAGEKNSVEIEHSLDQREMLAAIKSVDVAIVSASGIVMEVVASGTEPFIGFSASNQEKLYSFFRDQSDLSCFNALEFDREYFQRQIKAIRNRDHSVDLHKFRDLIKESAYNHCSIFKSLSHARS